MVGKALDELDLGINGELRLQMRTELGAHARELRGDNEREMTFTECIRVHLRGLERTERKELDTRYHVYAANSFTLAFRHVVKMPPNGTITYVCIGPGCEAHPQFAGFGKHYVRNHEQGVLLLNADKSAAPGIVIAQSKTPYDNIEITHHTLTK
jgi:hypothetical protein